jgi:hypothetical protein
MSRVRHFIALIFFAGVLNQAGAQGHILGDNVVTVGVDQFGAWTVPFKTVVLTDDGVRPNKLLRDANVMLTVADFLRERPPEGITKAVQDIEILDAIEAGSNRDGVANVLDGRMDTYWEPDPPSSPDAAQNIASEWWFTVDLGRLVIADRIVLRFAEDGDPFRLFDVLTSDGQKPTAAPAGDAFDFMPVLQTLEPNSSQREFEIDLTNLGQEAREQAIRSVQVVVKSSALDLGKKVADLEAWEALDPAERGRIEYTKLLGEGADQREYGVAEDIYNQLADFRRGPIYYHRRELPRLAELEVWGGADEIVSGALLRGGSIESKLAFNADLLIDGNVGSKVSVKTNELDVGAPLGNILFDLGSSYWISGQRMVTNFRGNEHTVSFPNYALDFSDGSREPDGSLSWHRAVSIEQPEVGEHSTTGYWVPTQMHVDRANFELVKARFFRLEWVTHLARKGQYVNLAEMQLFGTGYQPEVWLESDPIQLPGSQNLTEIQWEADTPLGTKVVMQTKTGNVLLPDTLYYKDDGTLLGRGEAGSKKYYGRAFKNSQGEKVIIFEEGPEWSELSEIYADHTGSAITSPAPRKILKIRATLISDSPDTAAVLKSIVLNFSDPVARRLLAEVTPTRVAALGVEQPFSLFVGVDSLEQGFNEILLRAPSGMVIGEDETVAERVQLFTGPASVDELEPRAGVTVLGFGDSLHVSFPLLDAAVEVVRLDFPAILYSAGGRLEASLRNSDSEFWQRVDVGDALKEVTSNTMLVVAQPESKELFQGLDISPRVATPNDDGVNDELVAEFTVVLLGDNETVEMEIYDLSGHLVRRLSQSRVVSAGRYRMAWDGLDESDQLVPPGLYTVRLGLQANTDGAGLDKSTVLQTVAVTY